MKKIITLPLLFVALFILCLSIQSCNKEFDGYNDESSNVVELTKADIFIASEEYQAWEKFMNRDARRMRIIRSKLSQEQKSRLSELFESLKQINDYTQNEVYIAELSGILGFDYGKRALRMSEETRKVFAGSDFTKLELLKAQQRYAVNNAKVSRTKSSDDDLEERIRIAQQEQAACMMGCLFGYESAQASCESSYGSSSPKQYANCTLAASLSFDGCVSGCESKYPIPTS